MTALLKLSLNDRGAFTAAELRQGHDKYAFPSEKLNRSFALKSWV